VALLAIADAEMLRAFTKEVEDSAPPPQPRTRRSHQRAQADIGALPSIRKGNHGPGGIVLLTTAEGGCRTTLLLLLLVIVVDALLFLLVIVVVVLLVHGLCVVLVRHDKISRQFWLRQST
jgi:hypothetical protein